jgi:hypothetical protein
MEWIRTRFGDLRVATESPRRAAGNGAWEADPGVSARAGAMSTYGTPLPESPAMVIDSHMSTGLGRSRVAFRSTISAGIEHASIRLTWNLSLPKSTVFEAAGLTVAAATPTMRGAFIGTEVTTAGSVLLSRGKRGEHTVPKDTHSGLLGLRTPVGDTVSCARGNKQVSESGLRLVNSRDGVT